MQRLIELIKMEMYAEWRMFIEFWWLWLAIILVMAYFIIKEE